MPSQSSVQVRSDLTKYAHAVMQDMAAILRVANLIAPTVPTGGTSGLYNKFDTTNDFKAYSEALSRRSVGSHATEVGLLGTTANYVAEPYGLRTKIDQHERARAGNLALLEEAKTRTLMVSCSLSHLVNLITLVKAAVAAAAGKGDWGNPNVDPIQEINDQIKAVWLATGMVPNTVLIDFGAWCVLSGNPKVIARMPGADLASVTKERVGPLLVNPAARIEIVESAVNYGGGLGNSAATKRGVLQGSVLVFHSSLVPTEYDPSFAKTFAPSATLFTNIFTYREEPHFDWFENDWTCQPVVVSSGLCKRIDVTGANS
jgi:hypothetical protein